MNGLANDWRHARTLLIVGGSFDPPHLAHRDQPRRVADALQADVMLYIPVGQQPQKQGQRTPATHRLAMLRLMLADQPGAFISTLEIDRAQDGSPSYTVDTLRALRETLGPVESGGPVMRLLIGSDQALGFHTWREPDTITRLAEPVVMTRPPLGRGQLLDALAQTHPAQDVHAWASRIVEVPMMEISSTQIRERIKKGRSLTGLVSPEVERYIRQHRLYQDE